MRLLVRSSRAFTDNCHYRPSRSASTLRDIRFDHLPRKKANLIVIIMDIFQVIVVVSVIQLRGQWEVGCIESTVLAMSGHIRCEDLLNGTELSCALRNSMANCRMFRQSHQLYA